MLSISKENLKNAMAAQGVTDMGRATIRQCVNVAKTLEKTTGEPFVHLELGIPGLDACKVGVEAQLHAIESGVASVYPPAAGIPELKENGAKFVKAYTGIDLNPRGVIPTVGAMQACYNLLLECSQLACGRRAVLYLDPGFPSHYIQAKVLGLEVRSFDLGDFRGEKLRLKLEEMLSDGKVCAMVYSNPNNPSWMCLSEEELRIIGEACTRYDVVALEDMAYMCMDFRRDVPYQPTVARYTDNWVMMISASKIFSYAGERIAVVAISDALYGRKYAALEERYGLATFGDNFAMTYLYVNISGASHSAQIALSAMFRAAAEGIYDFVAETRRYAERAHRLKEIFLRHGFHLVYDKDIDADVSDGFFFTIGYNGLTGGELQQELMRCGISAISLASSRSRREGVRICVALLKKEEDYSLLDERLSLFSKKVCEGVF